jgi:hypothetical protein
MMANKLVEFLERAFVEKQVDTLARRKFAGFMLAFPPFRTAACLGLRASAAQFFQSPFLRR